jgi:hypothetical protein
MTASPVGMDIDEARPEPVAVPIADGGVEPMNEESAEIVNSTEIADDVKSVDLSEDIIDPSPEKGNSAEVAGRSPSPGIFNFVHSPPPFRQAAGNDEELRVELEDVSMSDLGGLFE